MWSRPKRIIKYEHIYIYILKTRISIKCESKTYSRAGIQPMHQREIYRSGMLFERMFGGYVSDAVLYADRAHWFSLLKCKQHSKNMHSSEHFCIYIYISDCIVDYIIIIIELRPSFTYSLFTFWRIVSSTKSPHSARTTRRIVLQLTFFATQLVNA